MEFDEILTRRPWKKYLLCWSCLWERYESNAVIGSPIPKIAYCMWSTDQLMEYCFLKGIGNTWSSAKKSLVEIHGPIWQQKQCNGSDWAVRCNGSPFVRTSEISCVELERISPEELRGRKLRTEKWWLIPELSDFFRELTTPDSITWLKMKLAASSMKTIWVVKVISLGLLSIR